MERRHENESEDSYTEEEDDEEEIVTEGKESGHFAFSKLLIEVTDCLETFWRMLWLLNVITYKARFKMTTLTKNTF